MKRIILAFLSASLLVAADKSGLDPERLAKIPQRMKSFVDQGRVAGIVTLVARHGEVAFFDAVGMQDAVAGKPMQKDSIFQIMSMTKPMTGVAIMMLAEDGKLSVTDPVEKHLPEFKGQMLIAEKDGDKTRTLRKPSRLITIRDLMTHTSGMMQMPPPSIGDLYQKLNLSLADAVNVFAQHPIEFEPGAKWAYSNTGLATLGRIVEVAGDMPFEQFLAQRIFVPLGMKDSFIFPPADKLSRIAIVHHSDGGKVKHSPATILGGDSAMYRKGAKYSGPEFAAFSTAADLAAFYQMMLNNGTYKGKRLLSKASIDAMTAVQTGDLKSGHNPGTAFGLTWEVTRDPAGSTYGLSPGTFGHGGAFGTHGWIDRQKDLVGVFLIQSGGGGDATAIKYAFMQMAAAALTD